MTGGPQEEIERMDEQNLVVMDRAGDNQPMVILLNRTRRGAAKGICLYILGADSDDVFRKG
jgi:hypothetical protein